MDAEVCSNLECTERAKGEKRLLFLIALEAAVKLIHAINQPHSIWMSSGRRNNIKQILSMIKQLTF